MRVLVCGGRDYADVGKVWQVLGWLFDQYGFDLEIVHGAAPGADTLAEEWAKKNQVDYLGFPARWATEARRAGMARNLRMRNKSQPDLVVAFPGGVGTAGMVRLAREAGIQVWEIE